MPRDYDYQAPLSPNGERSDDNSFGNEREFRPNANPFSPRNSRSGYGSTPFQSPFVNAQQRSTPSPDNDARDFVPTIVNNRLNASSRRPLISSADDDDFGGSGGFSQGGNFGAGAAPGQAGGYDAGGGYGPGGNFGAGPAPGQAGGYNAGGGYSEEDAFIDEQPYIPDSGNPDSAGENETWSDEFNDFERISQQQGLFNGRRSVSDIFDYDQLQRYDRNKFSELHYLLQQKLSRNPRDLNTLIGMALCSLAIGEPAKSAEYFAKATEVDEAVRPSKYLHEVPSSDPDDWLDMAEELGHFGILDGSMELCSSIVDSNKFSDRVRRQALKVREAIQQDYFAARDRIMIGSNQQNKKDNFQAASWINNIVFIIAPLMLAILLGCLVFYSINVNNGKTALGHAIYRLEYLKKGNYEVERMGKCDYDLSNASEYFRKAKKFNPFTKEIYFYELQIALLTKELGRVRSSNENEKWDKMHWQTVKENCNEAQKAYDDLGLSTEKDLELKNEWQNFVIEAKKEENAPI